MGKRIEFTTSDLAYIVNSIDISGVSYEELGEEFGCSRTTIWRRYNEAKAELPETEVARLSDKRKQEYEEREAELEAEEIFKDVQKEMQEYEDIYPQVDEEEVEEGFFEKIKGWFKYILTGGDSTQW